MTSGLALGGAAALQLVAGVVRARGWFHVIRRSSPQAQHLRYRDVALAQLGGCGWNAVLPARAGDAVKIALVNRRTPDTPPATLVCTLAPPSLVDVAFTAILVTALVAAGGLSTNDLGSSLPAVEPGPVLLGGICVGLLALVLFRRHVKRLARDARAGMKAIGQPGFLIRRVAPWHAASRGLRLLALALVLVAAGLPFGIVPALVLMALLGATPSAAPAATAIRVAIVAGAFAATTTVEPGQVAAALIAWYGASSAVNLTASAAVIAWVLRTLSPRRIVGYARTAFAATRRERPAGAPAVAAPPAASAAPPT